MALLDLPESPYWRVWTVIYDRLSADATLQAAGVNISQWDGTTDPLADLESNSGAAIQFIPSIGPARWYFEDSQLMALVCNAQMYVPRAAFEDAFNLQCALETAITNIYQVDYGNALVKAGAATGLILFQQPARPTGPPQGQANRLMLSSVFTIEVQRQFSSQQGV